MNTFKEPAGGLWGILNKKQICEDKKTKKKSKLADR
jgi:hypothetical protein